MSELMPNRAEDLAATRVEQTPQGRVVRRMGVTGGAGDRWSLPWGVWLIAASVFVLEMAVGPRYGLFRDEYYYLACADHLAWGYVDHPPLSIAVLAAVKALLGDSLPAVRLVPALLGALLVLLGGRLARALGGGRFACILGAFAVAAVPRYLGAAGYYSMNSFDLVLWAAAALLIARLTPETDTRAFVVLGVVLGLGLLNKVSVLFLGAGLAVALVLTPLRRLLARPGPWIAAVIAALLFAPHLVWQMQHGWPTLEFIQNAARYKNVALSPVEFFGRQIPEMGPPMAPLWLAGLGWLLWAPRARPYRSLGIVFVVAFAILAVQHSKPYYLGAAFPPLFAAAAVFIEGLSWRRIRAVAVALVLASGALSAPFAIPVLPIDTFIAYQSALGQTPETSEKQDLGPLPQFFADRFGWQELTDAVAQVYDRLPPEERAKVAIVTSNYGEAGALRYLGRRIGLPSAVSQHNSFYFWGPGQDEVAVAIVVGMNAEGLRDAWTSIEVAGRFSSPYAMPYEQSRPILLCRGLKLPLADAWARGKKFI